MNLIPLLLCLLLAACSDDASSDGDSDDDGAADESSLADTPECDAWCAKIEALGCPQGSCDRDFFCSFDAEDGECAESKRAELQCSAEQGSYMCTENGWSGSGCPTDNSICPTP